MKVGHPPLSMLVPQKFRRAAGIGLVEIVIAAGIFAAAGFALMALVQYSTGVMDNNLRRIQAAFLAEEGIEAVRHLRDQTWPNIGNADPATPYYLVFTPGTPASWSLTSVAQPQISGTFTRQVQLPEVQRSGADDIVTSGGVVDPNTRLVRVTISWQDRGEAKSLQLETYLTNVFGG